MPLMRQFKMLSDLTITMQTLFEGNKDKNKRRFMLNSNELHSLEFNFKQHN